jgi:hypothetical protein
LPHAPQFIASETVTTHWLLQFVVPFGQVTVQTPLEQTLPPLQVLAQAPQLLLSLCLLTQALPHSERPGLQLAVQWLATQAMLPPTGAVGQALPQVPQFMASLDVFEHAPLQLVYPVLQLKPHAPAPHAGVPLATPAHAVPQAPQFAGSDFVSAHAAPHCVVPCGQLVTHLPAAQSWPLAQTVPHAPQLAASVPVSTHLFPHLANPVSQTKAQLLAAQVAFAFAGAVQPLLQAPQLLGSVVVSRHSAPH